MPKTTAAVSASTTLGELLKANHDVAVNVLVDFGIIHCAHCELDERQSIEAACREHGAPTAAVVKALAAALR